MNRFPSNFAAQPSRGFALLITVTLLAFLVLLLVSLASLTRVETRVAANSQQLALARQNAQFALNLALGRLQSLSGKDRRITATSGAFAVGVNAGKKNWTGVWNTETTAAVPPLLAWLVSDTSPNPATAPLAAGSTAGAGVLLLGPGTLGATAPADDQVMLERRTITATQVPGFAAATSRTIGHYAWWVADEGVKLNLAVPSRIDQLSAIDAGFTDDADRDRLAQHIAPRTGVEMFGAFALQAENDADSLVRWHNLRQALTPAQLKLPATLGISAAAQEFLALNTHQFTTASRGVLSDSSLASTTANETQMQRGGLRKNLSDPANGEKLPQAWFDFIRSRPVPTGATTRPEIRIDAYGGNCAPIRPFFTEVAIDVVPFRNASGKLAVKMRIKAEVANPYSLPIAPSPSPGKGYLVKLSSNPGSGFTNTLPTLHVFVMDGPPANPLRDLAVNLKTVFDSSPDGWLLSLDTPLEPGEVRVLSSEIEWSSPASIGAAVDKIDHYTIPATMLGISFKLPASVSTALGAGIDLCNLNGARYAEGDRTQVPLAIDLPMDDIYRTRGFSWHLRVNSAAQSWRDWTRSSTFDPAAPMTSPVNLHWQTISVPDADYQPSFETVLGPWSDNAADFPNPVDIAMTAHSQFALSEFFSSARRIPIIYDVPTGPLFSVGELTHLPFWHQNSGAPERWLPSRQMAFSLGRPEGGAAIDGPNALFDRGFFAPVPATWAPGELLPDYRQQPVPHSRFGSPTLADLQGQDAALFLLTQGTFNLNSTSVLAWQGVLGRALVNWLNWEGKPPSGTTDGQPVLRNPIVTRPQTAHYGPEVVTADDFSIRQLSAPDVARLAAEIVSRIDARATPFTSLREFFSSTLLDQAITDAGLNQSLITAATASGDEQRLGAEQWASPEKIAVALAPFLAARSDTFLIRTYGAAINPGTDQLEGEAWLEAVVQRMPELVDGGTAPTRAAELVNTSSVNTTFGRRFQVVSFRWLSKNDL